MMSSTQFAPSPSLPTGTTAFASGLNNVDLVTAFGAELPCPPSIAFSEFTPACISPNCGILKAENDERSQVTAFGTPSEAAALSKPHMLSDPLSSLVDGLDLPLLSAGAAEQSSNSCCSSSSETITTHGRANEGESKCDTYHVDVMQAQENTNEAQVELDAAVDSRPVAAGHVSGLTTSIASVIGGLSMQPLIIPQRLQMAQSKSWDQILDMLYIIPGDAQLAIRQTIIEALAAIEAAGGAVPPVVARCLYLAISMQDPGQMRLIGLRTLEKCRPAKQEDLLDKLCSFLALQPSSAVPVVPPVPIKQPATTRPPLGYGIPTAVRGDANFREAVAKKCSRPWHELIEEIRTMKPNNGYPVRVNITAAIKSATVHQVHRSADVARRLAYSLSLYCRKSCGATKQEALKVLELAHDAREQTK